MCINLNHHKSFQGSRCIFSVFSLKTKCANHLKKIDIKRKSQAHEKVVVIKIKFLSTMPLYEKGEKPHERK